MNHKYILNKAIILLPILLYYGMSLINSMIDLDKYIGPNHMAAEVGKLFIYGIIGFFLSGFLYPLFVGIEKNNKGIGKILFIIANYPVDYLFYQIILFALLAENLNPIVRTPLYIFILISLSTLIQSLIDKFISHDSKKDIRQEVIRDGFVRTISLFLLVLITLFIFIKW